MSKFIYVDTENNSEANRIEFDINGEIDIFKFKLLCMRMALAMGYSPKNISEVFGDVRNNVEFQNELKQFNQYING